MDEIIGYIILVICVSGIIITIKRVLNMFDVTQDDECNENGGI